MSYSQPAPNAGEAWRAMADTCRDVVDALLLADGVTLEEGEYSQNQP